MKVYMDEKEIISIMLVDDHDMVRLGLRTAIEASDSLEVVAEAKNGTLAYDLYRENKPDVVLMDLLMPELNGIEAAKLILEYDPNAKILALTSYEKDELVKSAVQVGIKGYILKSIRMKALEAAIHDVYQGNLVYGQAATQSLIRIQQLKNKQEELNLTPSELGVLELVATGMSNKEIANKLFISTSTVKKHVSNILGKLDAKNRAEATAIAIEHKLFENT